MTSAAAITATGTVKHFMALSSCRNRDESQAWQPQWTRDAQAALIEIKIASTSARRGALIHVNADATEAGILRLRKCRSREVRMDQRPNGRVYTCPMHSDVRQSTPGKCPKCGMALLPEGTRFALLRHMISNPFHLAIMIVGMVAVMAAVMMLWH
jgi:Heavy metal binding domain